jgi:hypothetical protein
LYSIKITEKYSRARLPCYRHFLRTFWTDSKSHIVSRFGPPNSEYSQEQCNDDWIGKHKDGNSMSGKGHYSTLDPNTSNTNTTENELNQDGDDESLLDEFFAEIESLKIHDENENDDEEDDGDEQVESEKDETNTGIIDHPRSRSGRPLPQIQKEQQQKSMIDRAESTKDNWKIFTIAEPSSSLSTTPPPSSLNATGRKPISFSLSIGAGNAKKKKDKKNNTRSKITRRQRQETESGPCVDFGFDDHDHDHDDETSSSLSPSAPTRRQDRPPPLSCPNHLFLPRWIVVLDTCAILESYESVCNMIQLARKAAATADAGAAKKSNFLHHSARCAFVSEALTIVVPYTVWDELDYRSKEIDDEHQRYKARRAARMLTDELRREQQQEDAADRRHHQTQIIGEAWFEGCSIRSQSRIESHRAVEEFVLLLSSSSSKPASAEGIANNDDKILACALCEQDRFANARAKIAKANEDATETNNATRIRRAATAGGVALITSDKVLTGKARADRLSVYSPSKFVRYYNKRMASLRSRESATSRGTGNV